MICVCLNVSESHRKLFNSMAQLPPKIPNVTLCASDFSDSPPPKVPSVASFSPDVDPFWADEFRDFSLARRQAHRRSVSDSITFLEAPSLPDDCRVNSGNVRPRFEVENEFDRLDDEKFMSLFSNDMCGAAMPLTFSCSKPSSPSDNNSINDEKEITNQLQQHQNLPKENEDPQQQMKNESKEVVNQLRKQQETQPSNNTSTTSSSDKITDPKRVKRILANRQSAQRSRVRKIQYITELERSVTSLQAEVSVLSPRVAFLDHQRMLLNVDNGALKQRIAALAQDKIFKDAHQEALKREIERLRQVYHQQNLKNTEYGAGSASPSPNPQCHGLPEKEPLLNI